MHQHIYLRSWAGMEGFSPGETLPGGTRAFLLQSPFYSDLPVCPSGGTYTFWSETTYNGNKDVFCSHAEAKGHEWSEGDVPELPKP